MESVNSSFKRRPNYIFCALEYIELLDATNDRSKIMELLDCAIKCQVVNAISYKYAMII